MTQQLQVTEVLKWLQGQDLYNDPVWKELRAIYGAKLSDSEWKVWVDSNANVFLAEYLRFVIQPRNVVSPTKPGGSSAVSPKVMAVALQDMKESSRYSAEQLVATPEMPSLPKRLEIVGKAITKRNRLLIVFVVSLFLFFSFFDWQTSRYGVMSGANIDPTSEMGSLLKFVGELIVLVMIFAESFLQLLGRLVRMIGAESVLEIPNRTVKAWMLIGYGVMLVLLLANYWYSFVPVNELYGPVIGVCLAILPTVFQVLLFEVILGYLFAEPE